MFYELCGPGNWGSLGYSSWGFPGAFGVWGWIGLTLNLVFWVGLLGILTLLMVRAARRARGQTGSVRYATGQPTAMEILQARYAQSEITREQYERMKQDIG
jgi:uncharacterized membrane protein